jgi:hypothetical protein
MSDLRKAAEQALIHCEEWSAYGGQETANKLRAVLAEFDDCTASPTGKHSEEWFANQNCIHCGTGQVDGPLYYSTIRNIINAN